MFSPIIRHGFTEDEERDTGSLTALLTNSFWQMRFGGDAPIIGCIIHLNRVAHTVIGVVPDLRAYMDRARVLVPLSWTPAEHDPRQSRLGASESRHAP